MPRRFPVHKPYPKREAKSSPEKQDRQRRPSAASRGYDYQWGNLRRAHLASNPLCVYCIAAGKTELGNVVDHIRPHKGNRALLLDPGNLQTLCYHHHNSVKQSEERNPQRRKIGLDGLPQKD